MNKNNFFNLDNKKAIDAEFLTLWSRKAGNSVISEYIRDNYFPFAYAYAAKILENKAIYGNLEDEVASLTLDTMSGIIKSAEKGTLNYMGKAAFSTYLFSALNNGKRARNKVYYPFEVKRKGLPAMEVYRLLLIEKYSSNEISSLIKENFKISEEKIQEYINLACSYNEKESNRKADKKLTTAESYDQILEVAPQWEKGSTLTPEREFFRQHDLKLLVSALSSLNNSEEAIIKGYFLEERWGSIKEMQEELKLKNGAYEIKKAKDKIKSILEDEIIFE